MVRSRRTDGHARFEMRHVRWSACRAFALADEDAHRAVRATRATRRDETRATARRFHAASYRRRTDHPSPPPSFAGARELRPRVPPVVHPQMVQLQEGCVGVQPRRPPRAAARAVSEVQGALRHGEHGDNLPGPGEGIRSPRSAAKPKRRTENEARRAETAAGRRRRDARRSRRDCFRSRVADGFRRRDRRRDRNDPNERADRLDDDLRRDERQLDRRTARAHAGRASSRLRARARGGGCARRRNHPARRGDGRGSRARRRRVSSGARVESREDECDGGEVSGTSGGHASVSSHGRVDRDENRAPASARSRTSVGDAKKTRARLVRTRRLGEGRSGARQTVRRGFGFRSARRGGDAVPRAGEQKQAAARAAGGVREGHQEPARREGAEKRRGANESYKNARRNDVGADDDVFGLDSRKRARETPHDASLFASRVSRGWGRDDGASFRRRRRFRRRSPFAFANSTRTKHPSSFAAAEPASVRRRARRRTEPPAGL